MMQVCPFGVEAYFQNYFKYSWLRVTLRHANSLDWRGLQGYWELTGFRLGGQVWVSLECND